MKTKCYFGNVNANDQAMSSSLDGLQQHTALLNELSVKIDEYFEMKAFRF